MRFGLTVSPVYATYLVMGEGDTSSGLALDNAGSSHRADTTNASDFPNLECLPQRRRSGVKDGTMRSSDFDPRFCP